MIDAERQTGYYWVIDPKTDFDPINGPWSIAFWSKEELCWFYEGERSSCDKSIVFSEIDENRIIREN